jgi:hypothetical protein
MVQSIYTKLGQTDSHWSHPHHEHGEALGQAFYRTVRVHDLDIFYREAGPKDGPVILLLRGAVIVAIFRCS